MRHRAESIASFVVFVILVVFVWSFVTGLANPLHSRGPEDVPLREITAYSLPSKRIRIEVLNGSGLSGAARAAANRLRDRGFDVVYIGNAPNFNYEQTEVIARTTDTVAARTVAQALGTAQVRNEPDSMLVLEVTVVLGRDWQAIVR